MSYSDWAIIILVPFVGGVVVGFVNAWLTRRLYR